MQSIKNLFIKKNQFLLDSNKFSSILDEVIFITKKNIDSYLKKLNDSTAHFLIEEIGKFQKTSEQIFEELNNNKKKNEIIIKS